MPTSSSRTGREKAISIKGNALLIRTTQKGLGDIWSINVMKSKYSCAPGETENITGLLGGTAFYKACQ